MGSIRGYTLAMTASAAVLGFTASAEAGGFAIKERSTRAQGLSFAGVTAGSGGIESMGFNPAAIGLVEDLELSGGISLIQPIADGRVTTGPFAGQSVDADRFAGLANGYVGYRLHPDILIGLSMYTPFGLTTQYSANSAPAIDAVTSKFRTLVFAPTVAFEPIPELTLAASMNLTYVDARLTTATDILDGDNLDLSFSAGALWRPTSTTQVGLAYQHGYGLDIPGTLTINTPANLTADTNVKTDLPAVVSVGVVQGVTDDFRLMGEFQWQNWSVFEDIKIQAPGLGVNAADPQNYDDAFFLAVGGEYDVTDSFTIRLGAAWDQTPTNSGTPGPFPAGSGVTNRTARVPDEDRIWISTGASYDVDEHMTLHLGYSYLFTIDEPVVGLRGAPGGTPTALTGTRVVYDGGAHIFSIGGSLKF